MKTPPPVELASVWPRLNKQDWLDDYLAQLQAGDYHHGRAAITETLCLTAGEWEEFVQSLLTDRAWLAGKGYSCDRIQHHCLLVCCPGETVAEGVGILVDPQGHNYARYVGFCLGPDRQVTNPPGIPTLVPGGPTFADRILQRAANSPHPPPPITETMNETMNIPTVPTLVTNAAGQPVLLVPVPLETPRPSSTGKTLIVGQVAGGYGPAVCPATGKPIRLNLTAMVKV